MITGSGLSDTAASGTQLNRPADLEPGRPRSPEERQQALVAVLRELERRFGPGVVYRLSQATPKVGEQAIPTGSFGVDRVTGIGGVPRGRLTELLGPESSGKTTLLYQIVAQAQRDRGLAVFVDAEQSADPDAMARLGVDLADLILVVPATAVEALEIAEILVRSQSLDLLAFSSIPGLCALPAERPPAMLLAQALRTINPLLSRSPTALVVTNRLDPGYRRALGGRALAFYASLRLALQPFGLIGRPWGDVVGLRVRVEAIKNKLATPQRSAVFDLLEDRGVDRAAELIDWGLAAGLIEDHPLGLLYRGQVLGKGRSRAARLLERLDGLGAELEAELVVSVQILPADFG